MKVGENNRDQDTAGSESDLLCGHVLVVDDDPQILEVLVHMFKREGFDCVAASDGLMGLLALKTQQPDLIVTDLVMPQMDGVEFIEQVRSTWPEMKVIYLSAFLDIGTLRKRVTDDIQAYGYYLIEKPFHLEKLIKTVRAYMDGLSSTDAST